MNRPSHRAPALLIALLVAICFGVSAAPLIATAQEVATPRAAADDRYHDPDGRYSVPIPTNWTVDERDGYVVLTDPDDDITVSMVVVAGDDAETAIEDAWAIVDPSYNPNQPGAIEQEVPSNPGIDTTLVITYDLGSVSGNVLQAAAQVADDTAYVLIIAGSLDAVTRRNSQVQVIGSGFEITDLETVDLAGVAAKPFRGELVREFQTYAEELLARLEIPGASVAVVQDGKMVYAEGFGVKEFGGRDAVTPDTLMMIGSTTKSMTTMMMATEVDDGLLRWDQPVVELLPDFAVADPDLSETITVRNLVCACTGVPRRDLELAFNATELTPESVIASLKGFEFSTAFGEAFQYSNQMVAVGGYAAAAAAGDDTNDLGETYAAELQERVLDPIGMDRTTLDFTEVAADPDHASPHGLRLDYSFTPLALETESFVVPVAPAGAIWSSAEEMARYALTELGDGVAPDGTRVVSEKNLAETWQPQVAVDAETSYGLGWFVGEYQGQPLIAHGGNTYGFTSDLALLPDADVGIVVLANAQGATLFTEGLRAYLFELLFDQPHESVAQIDYAVEQTEQTKAAVRVQLANSADADEVEPYLGRYTSPVLGDVSLVLDGNRLILDAGEFQAELRPLKRGILVDPGYFLFDPPLSGLPVDLRENADGEPEIALELGTDQYIFSFIDKGPAPASPVASGSPEAEASESEE